MKVGIVIVTYNRLALLKECVQNVLEQSEAVTKIIIINNNSTDGTSEWLDSLDDNRMDIIHENENLGGAGGFAAAIHAISKEALDWDLIIDDDAMIEKNYIKYLLQFIEKHPTVNACSGVVKTNNKIIGLHRRRIINKLLFLERNVPEKDYEEEYFKCDLATFCGLFIKHSVLKEIGIPKAEYFIWYDDTEYCMRLMKYGGIYNVNAAVLNHKTAEPVEEKNIFLKTSWKSYYGYRNRYDAARIHFSSLTKLIVGFQFYVFLLCNQMMKFNKKYREKAIFNVQMYNDAYKDAKKQKLGKNKKYLPG